jgi:hypothetical protein
LPNAALTFAADLNVANPYLVNPLHRDSLKQKFVASVQSDTNIDLLTLIRH